MSDVGVSFNGGESVMIELVVPNSGVDTSYFENQIDRYSGRLHDPSDFMNKEPRDHWVDINENLRKLYEKVGDPFEPVPFESPRSFVCGPTTRYLDELALLFQQSPEEFIELLSGDKLILDIGGGKSNLQRQLGSLGITSTVINLDLESAYTYEITRADGENMKWIDAKRQPSVIARAEQMPFADESFDVILASYSVPFYTDSADDYEAIINEALRVLKVGGTASLAPMVASFHKENGVVGRLRMLGMLRSLSNMPELELDLDVAREVLRFKKLKPITDNALFTS